MAGMDGGSLFNFLLATDTAAANAKVNRARTEAREARNLKSAREATLMKWNQSLSNQKTLDAGGEAYNTITENLNRRIDANAMSTIQGRLAVSEELGAATAAAAFAGVGGSSVENYNQTIRTSTDIQRAANEQSFRSESYLMNKSRGEAMDNAIGSLNRDVITATMDYTNYGSTKAPSLLGNLATLGVAAGFAAAGAPQISDAIIKARTASFQQNYGTGGNANDTMASAFKSLGQGVNQVKDIFRFNNNSGSSLTVPTYSATFDPQLSSYLR